MMLFFCVFLKKYSITPFLENLDLPYLGKVTAAAGILLPIPTSGSCAVCLCAKMMHGCMCLGFLTCAQMLMHVNTHRGCTNAVRESALKADTGRQKNATKGN